jgi:hypothetical protein
MTKAAERACNEIMKLTQTIRSADGSFLKLHPVPKTAFEAKTSTITLVFDNDYFKIAYERLYPEGLLRFDPYRETNVKTMLAACYDHQYMNGGKTNEGRISLATLLKCTDLPQESKTKHVKQSITDKFFRDLLKITPYFEAWCIVDSRIEAANKKHSEADQIDPVVINPAHDIADQIEDLKKRIKPDTFEDFILVYFFPADYPAATGAACAEKRKTITIENIAKRLAKVEGAVKTRTPRKRGKKAEPKTEKELSTAAKTKPRL